MSASFSNPLVADLKDSDSQMFEALWEMPAEWIEPPNERRGGWSGATRVTLKDPHGMAIPCVLKKQQNHRYYSLRNGFFPRPTLEREARNLRLLQNAAIPVPDVFFYGRRKRQGADQAILLIPELVGYQPLSQILAERKLCSNRRAIGRAIGAIARQLHYEAGWYHRNFYPKHIFIKETTAGVKVVLIDLENSRPSKRQQPNLDDLVTLFRRAKNATTRDRAAFMQGYCQCRVLGQAERALMRQIATHKPGRLLPS